MLDYIYIVLDLYIFPNFLSVLRKKVVPFLIKVVPESLLSGLVMEAWNNYLISSILS